VRDARCELRKIQKQHKWIVIVKGARLVSPPVTRSASRPVGEKQERKCEIKTVSSIEMRLPRTAIVPMTDEEFTLTLPSPLKGEGKEG